MYEYILKNKRATYAFDPNKGIITFNNTKNINEILKIQNNLEELEALYKVIEKEYDTEILKIQKNYKNALLPFIICAIAGMLLQLSFSFMIGVSVVPLIRYTITNIEELKTKKRYTKKLTLLSDSINEEKEKFDTLNKTDEKVIIECEQPKVELTKSEEIEFLYNKLYLIDFVLMNKPKLKRLYKENLLEETLNEELSEKEVEYIKFLLNNKKEKNKVKQLKK